jgi:nicotinamide-nucleotide amidase
VAGSSDYFTGGFLTYSYQAKTQLLGIDPELLERHRAVSKPVAKAMAENALQRMGAQVALSVTGVAGPGQGEETEPVGTIYVGLATAEGCDVKRFQFAGDRQRLRSLATQTALDLLRRHLTAVGGSPWKQEQL